MLTVEFTILGDTVLARAISRYGDAVTDFSPVWEQIRQDFHRIEGEQFDTEGARAGSKWPPLSPDYAAWKARHFPGMPLMVLTGKMWGQMAVGVGLQVQVEPMSLIMSTTLQYPVYHQQGTLKMPVRKVVDLTEADKMGWIKMIHQFVYERAKEEGLA